MTAKELWDSMYAEKDLRPTDTCRGFAIHFAEAYHRAKVEAVTDGKSQTEMYHLKTPIDPKEKGEDSAYRAGRVSGMAYVRDKLLNQ